jgi:two-component system OmpR family sensor kinase
VSLSPTEWAILETLARWPGRVYSRYELVNSARGYRGTGASARSGSGIGLAVVSALVAAHGGTVRLESEQGRGSSFRVELPLIA